LRGEGSGKEACRGRLSKSKKSLKSRRRSLAGKKSKGKKKKSVPRFRGEKVDGYLEGRKIRRGRNGSLGKVRKAAEVYKGS